MSPNPQPQTPSHPHTSKYDVPEEHAHHHHGHTHSHLPESGSIGTAFLLNLVFTILEIFGGLWTNSIAILSDALHDLGDTISLGAAWFFDRYAQKENDSRFSYGYRRFALIGALLNTIILLIGSIFVLGEAIPRLLQPQPANAPGMVLFAIGGIFFNGLAVLRVRQQSGLNAQVVAWHLLEDVLGWVAVLVVSLVMLVVDLPILDPLLSILITVYVLYNVLGYFRRIMGVFLQAVPAGVDLTRIHTELLGIAPILSTHHTHVWSLDGDQHILTTHVVVPADTDRPQILEVKQQIRRIAALFNLTHITIEVEREQESCLMSADC